jgi:hypothetical protein
MLLKTVPEEPNLKPPLTSSFVLGEVVPIPILPPDWILILSVLFVFIARPCASVVPIKLVATVVPVLPDRLQVADDKSTAVEATPFTVEVRFAPLKDKAFELMMFTPVPVTPFTVVVSVLVDEVLLIVVVPV